MISSFVPLIDLVSLLALFDFLVIAAFAEATACQGELISGRSPRYSAGFANSLRGKCGSGRCGDPACWLRLLAATNFLG
jgi:hypothetical protein